jgi:RNA polymerase sigma-70 factor, ECF subfamily
MDLYNVGTEFAKDRARVQAEWCEIVEAARAGDEEAFARIVETLWPELVRFARSVLGRTAESEDVVQNALIRAWQQLPTLRSPELLRTWIWRIVYTQALQHLRGRRDLLPLDAARHEAIHLVTRDVNMERLLGLLTPLQRAVIYLSLVEEWTCPEIGRSLGINSVTVRIHRMRALARLRRRLGVGPT